MLIAKTLAPAARNSSETNVASGCSYSAADIFKAAGTLRLYSATTPKAPLAFLLRIRRQLFLGPSCFNTFLHRDGDRMVISKVVEVGALLLLLGLALERGEARLQGCDARRGCAPARAAAGSRAQARGLQLRTSSAGRRRGMAAFLYRCSSVYMRRPVNELLRSGARAMRLRRALPTSQGQTHTSPVRNRDCSGGRESNALRQNDAASLLHFGAVRWRGTVSPKTKQRAGAFHGRD